MLWNVLNISSLAMCIVLTRQAGDLLMEICILKSLEEIVNFGYTNLGVDIIILDWSFVT